MKVALIHLESESNGEPLGIKIGSLYLISVQMWICSDMLADFVFSNEKKLGLQVFLRTSSFCNCLCYFSCNLLKRLESRDIWAFENVIFPLLHLHPDDGSRKVFLFSLKYTTFTTTSLFLKTVSASVCLKKFAKANYLVIAWFPPLLPFAFENIALLRRSFIRTGQWTVEADEKNKFNVECYGPSEICLLQFSLR